MCPADPRHLTDDELRQERDRLDTVVMLALHELDHGTRLRRRVALLVLSTAEPLERMTRLECQRRGIRSNPPRLAVLATEAA